MTASIPKDKIAEVTGPIARFADTAEMADAVAFLASEEAGYITGVVLPVRRRHLHLREPISQRNQPS